MKSLLYLLEYKVLSRDDYPRTGQFVTGPDNHYIWEVLSETSLDLYCKYREFNGKKYRYIHLHKKNWCGYHILPRPLDWVD